MLESAIPYAGDKRPPETQVVSREAGDKGESLRTLSPFVGSLIIYYCWDHYLSVVSLTPVKGGLSARETYSTNRNI